MSDTFASWVCEGVENNNCWYYTRRHHTWPMMPPFAWNIKQKDRQKEKEEKEIEAEAEEAAHAEI